MQKKSNQFSFDGQSFYIGIDFHKKNWMVSIFNDSFELKTMSQNPDPLLLSNYLKKNYPGANYHAVYEAGFSGFAACRQLNEVGINCSVIHPADVPSNQKDRMQKTDKMDSRKLARALRSGYLFPIHIPDPKLEADRALVRQRAKIVKDLSRIKYRIKSLLHQFTIKIPEKYEGAPSRHWSASYTQWLTQLSVEHESIQTVIRHYLNIGLMLRKELYLVNREVRKLANTRAYKDAYTRLITVPGIGLIAAMTMVLELGDLRRFKRLDELCSFVGLIPRTYSSGERIKVGKMTKRGRKQLKIILIEAAWIAIRKDPALLYKFNELTVKMKKNKAIIRIARKLLARIRHIMINEKEYELAVIQ